MKGEDIFPGFSARWSPSNELAHSTCEMISNLDWDDDRYPQAKLGRDKAKKVMYSAVAHEKLPKPGYETYLGWCYKGSRKVGFYLACQAGKYHVRDQWQ